MASVEAATGILQKGNEEGNVFDHITNVVLTILQEKPDDALSSFENLSMSAKGTASNGLQTIASIRPPAKYIHEAQLKWSADSLRLLGATNELAEGVQNLYEDSLLLQSAGVNIKSEELFFLQCSMQNLVARQAETDDPINKIRFWGKLLGCRGADYSVFECECGSEVDVPDNMTPGMEGREGVNKYTYFVYCKGKMTKLPHIREQHIVIARQTHKFLTGDLNVDVSGYPPFPGKEAHYVRALIAQISSDTKVAPRNFFEKDEETAEIIPKFEAEEDGPDPLTPEEATDLSAWSHFEMHINTMGRMTAAPQVENNEGEMETDMRYEEAENSEVRATLGGLQEEDELWKVLTYPFSNSGNDSMSIVKSLRWPGGVAIAPVGKLKFTNCYVGYGIPSLAVRYTPPPLPSLQGEYSEVLMESTDITDAPIIAEDENLEDE